MNSSSNSSDDLLVYKQFHRYTGKRPMFYEIRVWRERGVIRFLAEWGPLDHWTIGEYYREFEEYPRELFQKFARKALKRGYELFFEEYESADRLYRNRDDVPPDAK